MKRAAITSLLMTLFALLCTAQQEAIKTPVGTSYKFDFGGKTQVGYTTVLPETKYTPERGYGIKLETSTTTSSQRKSKNALQDGYLTSDKPFYFSVKLGTSLHAKWKSYPPAHDDYNGRFALSKRWEFKDGPT